MPMGTRLTLAATGDFRQGTMAKCSSHARFAAWFHSITVIGQLHVLDILIFQEMAITRTIIYNLLIVGHLGGSIG